MKAEKQKCPLCNGELEYRELKTEDGSMRICKVYVCLNKKCEKIYFDYEIEEGGSGEVEGKFDAKKTAKEFAEAKFTSIKTFDKPIPMDLGEVDVVKAECEAVAAGYRKVSLREKKSVVGEEDDYKLGLEHADRLWRDVIVSRIQELEAEQNRSNRAEEGMWYEKRCLKARIEVLRGLLEKKEVLYIRPAPGTCCPEMNIKKGVCLGCGTKKKKPEKT